MTGTPPLALRAGEAHSDAMSATNPRDEYEALTHVIERLARRFPSVPEETVIDLVADEVSSIGVARLRTYIPVLVEGGVLRRLRGTRGVDAAGPEKPKVPSA